MVGLSAAILAAVVFVVLKLSLDARNCIKKLRYVLHSYEMIQSAHACCSGSNSPGRLHWTIVSPLTALVILVGKRFPPRGWFMHYDARFSREWGHGLGANIYLTFWSRIRERRNHSALWNTVREYEAHLPRCRHRWDEAAHVRSRHFLQGSQSCMFHLSLVSTVLSNVSVRACRHLWQIYHLDRRL